ncbi:MAG: hypothetical protein ACTSRK_13635 [Promethearchaeota archaeon]
MQNQKSYIRKISPKILVILLGFGLIFSINGNFKLKNQDIPTLTSVESLKPVTSQSIVLVDPIRIGSPDDWANYDFITGSGTLSDPYIIADIEIVGDGMSFEEEPTEYGIAIFVESNVIIQNCIITDFHIGIYSFYLGMDLTLSTTITECNISNCGNGIIATWGNFHISSNTITNCYVPQNHLVQFFYEMVPSEPFQGFGILAQRGGDHIVEGNTIRNCSIGSYTDRGSLLNNEYYDCGAIFGLQYLYYSVIEGNNVNDKPLGYFLDEDNLKIDGETEKYGQLMIFSCSNMNLSNIEISDTTVGVILVQNHNSTINSLVVKNCQVGLWTIEHPTYTQKIVDYKDLVLENCLFGLKSGFAMTSVIDEIENIGSVKITDFNDNHYDLVVGIDRNRMVNFTVPAGTSIFFDFYMEYRMVGWHNGLEFDNYTCIDSFYELSSMDDYENHHATEFILSDLGDYYFTIETSSNFNPYASADENEWQLLSDFTIEVVEKPKKSFDFGDIPGYSPVLLVICSFGALTYLVSSLFRKGRLIN